METKFQTSFIPKKQLSQTGSSISSSGYGISSLFLLLAIIIFVVSLAGAGGAYYWNVHLLDVQKGYREDLAARQKGFEEKKIEDLKQDQIKIDLARQLISNHLAVSNVFDSLGKFVSDDVRFMSLDLSAPSGPNAANDIIKISMRGYAASFPSIAWQAQVLSQLEKYVPRKLIKNPILSDPSLDSSGTVSFGFSATMDTKNFLYKDTVSTSTISTSTLNQGSDNTQ